MDNKILSATVRSAIDENDDEEWHIECQFADGLKYAPVVVDGDHEKLADDIAEWLTKGDHNVHLRKV